MVPQSDPSARGNYLWIPAFVFVAAMVIVAAVTGASEGLHLLVNIADKLDSVVSYHK